MKKSINLNSTEWCDIVFKNKNKSYGAYELRMSSSKRHVWAFILTLILAFVVGALPAIISKVSASNKEATDGLDMERIMSKIEFEKQEEEKIYVAQAEPPKPIHRNTIQFTAPIIDIDENIDPEVNPNLNEDVINDPRAVGYIDLSDGTDNTDAPIAMPEDDHRIVGVSTGPVMIAQFMPQFPGGESEMMSYIGNNLRYPVIDQETGTQGRVTVRFVVTVSGMIDQVEIMRGISPTADREAMRVVKSMPKWIPGRQNGKNVAVYFTLPILFRLR